MRFAEGNGRARLAEKRSAIADFDSAAAMLRALAAYLHGEDFALLGVFPTRATSPFSRAITVTSMIVSRRDIRCRLPSLWFRSTRRFARPAIASS